MAICIYHSTQQLLALLFEVPATALLLQVKGVKDSVLGMVAGIKSPLTHFLLWVTASSSLCFQVLHGNPWDGDDGLVMAHCWQHSLVVNTERPLPKADSKENQQYHLSLLSLLIKGLEIRKEGRNGCCWLHANTRVLQHSTWNSLQVCFQLGQLFFFFFIVSNPILCFGFGRKQCYYHMFLFLLSSVVQNQ